MSDYDLSIKEQAVIAVVLFFAAIGVIEFFSSIPAMIKFLY